MRGSVSGNQESVNGGSGALLGLFRKRRGASRKLDVQRVSRSVPEIVTPLRERQRAAALQDAGAGLGPRPESRSVLECASPLALSGALAECDSAVQQSAILRYLN